MFKNPIAISLSPNTESDDVWWALRILFQPWRWKKGNSIKEVEQWFGNFFGVDKAVSFNSGRSALYAILKTFEIGQGDEVIIQAFTCVAVAEPILWVGARAIFADVDETLNVNYRAIEREINEKTKAIIVQHTLGIPANLDMIIKIAQKHNLLLIEDCAHSLGTEYKGKKVGTFGDAAFFSFGRDKVISSVFGGIALINAKCKMQNAKLRLREFQDTLKFPSFFWILQQLLHPIAFAVILPLYDIFLGKTILAILIKLGILAKPVYKEELRGEKPSVFPFKYPDALAYLLTKQLSKLEHYNIRRKRSADYYYKNLRQNKSIILPPRIPGSIFLRFNILVGNAERLIEKAKKEKMILGNWYHKIVDPEGVDWTKIGYEKSSCPNAENAACRSLNLPTYPRLNEDEREKLVKFINKYAKD